VAAVRHRQSLEPLARCAPGQLLLDARKALDLAFAPQGQRPSALASQADPTLGRVLRDTDDAGGAHDVVSAAPASR
jgi:hypothetical protein